MGRKPKPVDEVKRHPIGFRTTKPLYDLLHASAERSGRSVAQEVEYRLERSFDRDAVEERLDALSAKVDGIPAGLLDMLKAYAPTPAPWLGSPASSMSDLPSMGLLEMLKEHLAETPAWLRPPPPLPDEVTPDWFRDPGPDLTATGTPSPLLQSPRDALGHLPSSSVLRKEFIMPLQFAAWRVGIRLTEDEISAMTTADVFNLKHQIDAARNTKTAADQPDTKRSAG